MPFIEGFGTKGRRILGFSGWVFAGKGLGTWDPCWDILVVIVFFGKASRGPAQ